jgi:hypothetical protein
LPAGAPAEDALGLLANVTAFPGPGPGALAAFGRAAAVELGREIFKQLSEVLFRPLRQMFLTFRRRHQAPNLFWRGGMVNGILPSLHHVALDRHDILCGRLYRQLIARAFQQGKTDAPRFNGVVILEKHALAR